MSSSLRDTRPFTPSLFHWRILLPVDLSLLAVRQGCSYMKSNAKLFPFRCKYL